MRNHITGIVLAAWMVAGPSVARVPSSLPQRKDYLTEEEADKIRDAETASIRVKLYLSFAEDRLKKFDYEVHRTSKERRRSEILNGLLNEYAGCVDDGADQIALAREKQSDIHDVLKLMETKDKEFLEALQKYDKDGPDLDIYRDTLEDAIEGTKDAISDDQEAQKELLAPPVRKKQ